MKSKYKIARPEAEWDGLSLDEIRYARALTRARIEISREMLLTRSQSVWSGRNAATASGSLLGRMLGALNWIDYGLIALRVGSKAMHIFKKKRK